MKKYFKYFIYISLLFLIFALYKADYLKIPKIFSLNEIILSILLLFFGFILESLTWKKTLSVMGYKSKFTDAIISIGLSIFGKYIPGKIWLIAGRSAYIAKQESYSEKELLNVSVITQLLSLWVGLLFGLFGLILLNDFMIYGTIAAVFWIFLTIIIFSKYPHSIFLLLINKIFKKNIKIPFINFKQIIIVLPWYFIRWAIYSVSFYFLVSGLSENNIVYHIGFGYALAGTLGLAVIFVPGGLGVREGILVAFFKLYNFPIKIATSISIASRLWFLAGEVFIFIFALILIKFKTNGTIKKDN